nr:hypothetical 37 kDa protein [uncultured bacterium]
MPKRGGWLGVPRHTKRPPVPLAKTAGGRLATSEAVQASRPVRGLLGGRLELAGLRNSPAAHAAGPALGDFLFDLPHDGRPARQHADNLEKIDVGLLVAPARINDVAHGQAVPGFAAGALPVLRLGLLLHEVGKVRVPAFFAREGIEPGRLALAALVGHECRASVALVAVGDDGGGGEFAGFGVGWNETGHGLGSWRLNDVGRKGGIGVDRPGHQLVRFVVVHLHPIALTPEIPRVSVGLGAINGDVVVMQVSALESGAGFRVRGAGLDAVALEVLGFNTCFARCLSRGVLLLNLCLVCHVGIRLSLCELASLSAFRREARRWAGQDRAEREKPEAARGTERSEYRTGEDFRA